MKRKLLIILFSSLAVLLAVCTSVSVNGPANPGEDMKALSPEPGPISAKNTNDLSPIPWSGSNEDNKMPAIDPADLKEYAYYGFHEVKQTPLIHYTFEETQSISDPVINTGSAGGFGHIVSNEGASLIEGRYSLGRALYFSGADTYISGPDLGQLDAVTVSCWLKLRDVQTRVNSDLPRVTTLLDTAAGPGRVTLKLVHTGIPPHPAEGTDEMDQGSNNTKLVFSVEGSEGGTFGTDGLYANNQRYYEYEYTFADRAKDWTCHPSSHCWLHIAVVYNPDNRTVTFYNSGKRDSEQRFAKAVLPVLNGIRIGAGTESGQSLDGAVDDVRIYNAALNAEDIEALGDFERDMWVWRTAGNWQDSTAVYYVNAEKGDDSNPGTRQAPFATVKKGIESIREAGEKVVIAPGLYREAGIELLADGKECQPVIIEAEKPGETIISGSSVLRDWQRTDTVDIYVHEWAQPFPLYNSSGNDFARRTDMLYIDGQPTEPAAALSEIRMNSYYLDEKAGCIYLMTQKTPDSFTAEVPCLGISAENGSGACLLHCNSHEYVVLRGLTFTDCATTIHSGMVKTGTARHMLIEDCTFCNANGQGLEIEHGTGIRTAEDIMISRCRFDSNGYGAIQAGFRSMNVVIENCEFTRTGWKVDWGEYSAPDPATMKMMFMKNIIVRHCRFDGNHDNDLWFDNSNWNVDINGNSFHNNASEISVHTEINPFGVQIRNNTGGGIRFANSEGTIVANNILSADRHPLITYWGTEIRYDGNNQGRINQGGPGLSWKDTILTNNIFILPGEGTQAFDMPPFESFYRMTASGNHFYTAKRKTKGKEFAVHGKAVGFDEFVRAIGDQTAMIVYDDPFHNNGEAAIGFRDAASLSTGEGTPQYIPVAVSGALDEAVSVSYVLWNADTGGEIGRGVLVFDPYQREKEIYIGKGGQNVLAELTGSKGIKPGSRIIHFQVGAKQQKGN